MGQRRSFRQADRGRILLASRSTLPGVDLTSGISRTRMRLLAATFRSTSRFNYVTRSLDVLSRDKRKYYFSLSLSFSLRDGIFLISTRRGILLCGGEYTVNARTRNLEPWSTDSGEIRAVLSVAFSCQSKRAESR